MNNPITAKFFEFFSILWKQLLYTEKVETIYTFVCKYALNHWSHYPGFNSNVVRTNPRIWHHYSNNFFLRSSLLIIWNRCATFFASYKDAASFCNLCVHATEYRSIRCSATELSVPIFIQSYNLSVISTCQLVREINIGIFSCGV